MGDKMGLGHARALLRADLIGQLARLGYATSAHTEKDVLQYYIPPELGIDGLTQMVKDIYQHFSGDGSVRTPDIENWLAERVAKLEANRG